MARIRCGIVGYGPVFEFGRAHGGWISAVPELELAAICDKDRARTALAKADFPGVATFNSLSEMLARPDIELVSVVVPHNVHKDVVAQCLRAGKHTIVDKPMAITVAECDAMIEEALTAGRTLAVFHNRRHDGNYRAIRSVVDGGTIGDVFRIELWAGGYGAPGSGWRARTAVTGGALYDWGAHAVDWVLSMVPSRMVSVTGFAQKLLWKDCDIEDEARAVIRFENGAVADVGSSYIAAAGKPLWYVLGTRGAIVDTGADSLAGYCPEYKPVAQSGGGFQLVTVQGGKRQETRVPYAPSDWVSYYADMVRHLRDGAPAPVSAHAGRRVIKVLETARRSARSGRTEMVEDSVDG
jgi:predicted dehydrogenase